MPPKKTKVMVGLSGGVDSSVAAWRLLNQGYEVIGVFIKVWHPDFLPCNWEAERLSAMQVAAHLGIPFLTCDAELAYRDLVANYFISEYSKGRTPNPDVMCNKYVKFGVFLDFASHHGVEFVATGHYAQKIEGLNNAQLHRGIDSTKDQSYFLWTLSNAQLKRILLPIGDTTKTIIREEAAIAGLTTAQKKDSQGICFLGQVDILDFLSHYHNLEKGAVLDEEGNIIGSHHGAIVYTIGQRHGFAIVTSSAERLPYYVISKNIDSNVLTVSTKKPIFEISDLIKLEDLTLREPIAINDIVQLQVRYRQTPVSAKVAELDEKFLKLELISTSERGAVGQSCVLYRDSLCLGGGIIS